MEIRRMEWVIVLKFMRMLEKIRIKKSLLNLVNRDYG